jgi:hypothetical protein
MTTPAKKWRAAGQQHLAAPDQPRSDNDAPLARRAVRSSHPFRQHLARSIEVADC